MQNWWGGCRKSCFVEWPGSGTTQINQWTCNMECIEEATKLGGSYNKSILSFLSEPWPYVRWYSRVISYTSCHIFIYNNWEANDQVRVVAITIKEPCHYHQQTKTHVKKQKALLKAHIIFLASHDIIMKIVQNFSFIIYTFHILISCIENTFDTQIY
jgi:hypothetical protein